MTLTHALTEADWLADPSVTTPALLIGLALFEAREVPWILRPLPSTPLPTVTSLIALHVAVAWYAAVRLVLVPASRIALEALHAALLYAALLLLLAVLRIRSGRGGPTLIGRIEELQAEARESRVQYEAVCMLLQRRDEEDEELSEAGDDRAFLIAAPTPINIGDDIRGNPALVLPHALGSRAFDRALARKIAARIRKPAYDLQRFYEDCCAAFPELHLYLARSPPDLHSLGHGDGGGGGGGDGASAARPDITSGLAPDEEYRRSIGALFAVYWLMRIGIDGERGFSFGVDDTWQPHMPPSLAEGSVAGSRVAASAAGTDKTGVMAQPAKRLAFYQMQDWGRLQQLLIDAGMLERVPSAGLMRGAPSPGVQSAAASSQEDARSLADGEVPVGGEASEKLPDGVTRDVRVHVERTMAMLALTAFHDVMKVQVLLPAVAAEHAPYQGFKAGDVINDHDIALGYVLDYHAELLPSFTSMTDADQRTIRFTQSKMAFNHGWLVQGEAPPSALFAKFKEVMSTEHVAPNDVAFYFVHWLTDLAGAEPSPLGGAEKFVLKFPHAVLDSFIRSFSVIHGLADASETEVMENYLVRTWDELSMLGPPPIDEDGIALMRLALQAQTPEKQSAVLTAYRALPREDAIVLREEMARTGIRSQAFQRAPKFKQVNGPAFLVYYSPAFLRTLAPTHALEALRLLAEVYRRARQLWPIAPTTDNAHAVTIRIDQIKELKLAEIQAAFTQGESWLLQRRNDNEGVVERQTLEYIQQQSADNRAVVLKFWRLERDGGSRGSMSRMSMRSKKSGGSGGGGSVGGGRPGDASPTSEAGGGDGKNAADELSRQLSKKLATSQKT